MLRHLSRKLPTCWQVLLSKQTTKPTHERHRDNTFGNHPLGPALGKIQHVVQSFVFFDTNAVEEGSCNEQHHRAFVSYAMLPSGGTSSSRGSIHKYNILDMLEPCIHSTMLFHCIEKTHESFHTIFTTTAKCSKAFMR